MRAAGLDPVADGARGLSWLVDQLRPGDEKLADEARLADLAEDREREAARRGLAAQAKARRWRAPTARERAEARAVS